MRISASLPTGVEALMMGSARRRRRLESNLVQLLEAAGFAEVIMPVLDYLEPYEALLSPSSREQLYRLVDRDGEVLALRGDFTPMLARLVAPRLESLSLPLKLYYRGDVLRYQEDRAGRRRELYQVGAEVLGMAGAAAEELALERFLELLTAARQPVADERRPLVVLGFAGALDKALAAVGGEQAGRLAAAVLRRDRAAVRGVSQILLEVVREGLPADLDLLGDAAASLRRVIALGESLGQRFPNLELRVDLAEFADQSLDPELRRQLGPGAYYDGLIFRAYSGRGAQEVGAGGRYDRLFRTLGADVTAAGFSFSLGRLMPDLATEGS